MTEINYQLSSVLATIGQKLFRARQLRDEKLEAVARTIGIHHGVISKIEHGRYKGLSIGLLVKLATYYGVSIDELFRQPVNEHVV